MSEINQHLEIQKFKNAIYIAPWFKMLIGIFVALDAQAVVKCEGETVKSVWVKNNLNPEWNIQCIFYRKKPEVPINVEVRPLPF